MNKLLALMFLWLLMPSPAQATAPLIADLSSYRIAINSSFTGTQLILFGARNDSGDIIVVIRGPYKDYIVRKKERVGGVWVNGERMKFYHIPDFYALASSRKLSDIEQNNIFTRLGIGEENLFIPIAVTTDPEKFHLFAQAFLDYQTSRLLYANEPTSLTFMGETLFKMSIAFPDNIPSGDYTAEIYLLTNGEITGMQSTPIKVVKSGFDAFLYACAHHYPAFYGAAAVALALIAGWGAGKLFEKI